MGVKFTYLPLSVISSKLVKKKSALNSRDACLNLGRLANKYCFCDTVDFKILNLAHFNLKLILKLILWKYNKTHIKI